ncbi:MAG TPA: phosphoribosylformylglycinamidine cyclo-ligase [Sulfitobacter sp.]|nr:phosphoribosylformylglycinamidine cyclo-ligase [Sulfitobacter sp.]
MLMKKHKFTYEKSGVNINAADNFVKFISNISPKNKGNKKFKNIGGFGSITNIPKNIKQPKIVASTDGVGTKIEIANMLKKYNTIGIDLVAMCVNDLIVQGAKPLLFLDYISINKIDLKKLKSIIKGIVKGCKISDCELVGGETAEMPGMYPAGDFDLAGFSVGAMERGAELPKDVAEGDVLLGLTSSGVHSNGYSLVRKLVEHSGLAWGDDCPWAEGTLGEALLAPTTLYVKGAVAAMNDVNALAHITGGGLTENLPRVLTEGMGADINLDAWELPTVFKWLAAQGGMEEAELLKTFNCGIGMIAVVPADKVETARAAFTDAGHGVVEMGHINKGEGVSYKGSLL